MWDYTDQVMDHFRNPKNVGFIKDPDGVGEVGSMACGDALRLMFKLDGEGKISDVKFQTFGCGSAIATSSALTEMIIGKTLEEAEKVTNQDIVDFLGGLPEQKMHCSVMGREALDAAIENYRIGTGEARKLDGRVVCICFGVTEEKIREEIHENHLTTVEQVTNYTKAGGGCGGCIPEIELLLAEIAAENNADGPQDKSDGSAMLAGSQSLKPLSSMTNLEKMKLIVNTIDDEIIPELKKHGGDLELVEITGNKVLVKLKGACTDCGMARFTLQTLVEPKLKEKVSSELEVMEA